MVLIYLIRHGKTIGNVQRRYVGRTDEPLCESGKMEICAQKAQYDKELSTIDGQKQLKRIYVSPMLRCKQTAELLFPKMQQTAVADFREMDFGAFEYKNYQELSADLRYQAFIDSGGVTDFPEAETQQHFRTRIRQAFGRCAASILAEETMSQETRDHVYVFVVHGGTIMAILDAYAQPHRSYFEWQAEAGAGYCCELEASKNGFYLANTHRILL